MADTGFIINDTTYAGEAASQFIVKAITGADTIQGGNVYVKDGIKKKFTIPRWDATYTDFIQDRAATPISQGTSTIDGQVLNPEDYMIYYEFNPRDFEDHWFATQLDETLIDRALPVSVESVVVQEILKRHAKYFNQMLWSGDTTTTGVFKYFDGFLRKALVASDTVSVPSPVTLTVSNIQDQFLAGYDLIPPALLFDPGMKFYCSYNTFNLYAQSQINQTYKGVDTTSEGSPYFKGRKVERIADFPDDVYLVAKGLPTTESNLWVGMNSTDDANLKLEKKQANSELYFVKMLMKADVQIGWNSETVLYNAGSF
jgi:hypothetical protein